MIFMTELSGRQRLEFHVVFSIRGGHDHGLWPRCFKEHTLEGGEKLSMAGFDIDVMYRIAADLGVKAEFVQLDWAGLLPGLAAGRFDAVASGVTPRTEK